ncbi:hypothetical protein DFAR_2730004 [Desulfarculales bacterium]
MGTIRQSLSNKLALLPHDPLSCCTPASATGSRACCGMWVYTWGPAGRATSLGPSIGSAVGASRSAQSESPFPP